MKIIVIGLGNQGLKRKKFAKGDFIASVDPFNKSADYKKITDVPLNLYDSALICTPDKIKLNLIKYCLKNKKHVLVEKPLLISKKYFITLKNLAKKNKLILYTGYNHRFEPHFIKMKKLLNSGKLGKIYSCKMFYGNGTAKLVYNSTWKDKSNGIIADLGSHLLDTFIFWFGKKNLNLESIKKYKFENRSPDHALLNFSRKNFSLSLEMSLCMWRNHFTCDILAEKGSAHITSLCKWGPSEFYYRKRKLPSGKPKETKIKIIKKDQTWKLEYNFFKKQVLQKKRTNLDNDLWISNIVKNLK